MKTVSWQWAWQRAVSDPILAKDLPASRRHVAFVLSLHMNKDGSNCFPSVAHIAKESGLSERTVQESVRDLERGGWLLVVYGGKKNGKKFANAHSATLPKSTFAFREGAHELHLANWGRVKLSPRRVQLSLPMGASVARMGATDSSMGATTAPQGYMESYIESYNERNIEGKVFVDDGEGGLKEADQDLDQVRY